MSMPEQVMASRTIVPMGGGGFSSAPEDVLLDDFILELGRSVRGRDRPHICFVGTASGDSHEYGEAFYGSYARRAEASQLTPFNRQIKDVDAFLLDQTSSMSAAGTSRTCARSGDCTVSTGHFDDPGSPVSS